jgi:hypothetical protein
MKKCFFQFHGGMSSEVRLYADAAEKDRFDNLGILYGIFLATEKLEKEYTRGNVADDMYGNE